MLGLSNVNGFTLLASLLKVRRASAPRSGFHPCLLFSSYVKLFGDVSGPTSHALESEVRRTSAGGLVITFVVHLLLFFFIGQISFCFTCFIGQVSIRFHLSYSDQYFKLHWNSRAGIRLVLKVALKFLAKIVYTFSSGIRHTCNGEESNGKWKSNARGNVVRGSVVVKNPMVRVSPQESNGRWKWSA